MTEHNMKPGDVLVVDGEAWSYKELRDQLAVERCMSGFHGRGFARAVLPHEVEEIRVAAANLPRRGRTAAVEALGRSYGVCGRTVYRYLEAA